MPQSQPWSNFTSTAEAHRRASGRRKHNALRQFNADVRRIEVALLMSEYGFATRGVRAGARSNRGEWRSFPSGHIHPDGAGFGLLPTPLCKLVGFSLSPPLTTTTRSISCVER